MRKWTIPFLLALALGCANLQPAPAMTPPDADQVARCKVGQSTTRPLIVEWPAVEKATLFSAANAGIVLVHYVATAVRKASLASVPGAEMRSRNSLGI